MPGLIKASRIRQSQPLHKSVRLAPRDLVLTKLRVPECRPEVSWLSETLLNSILLDSTRILTPINTVTEMPVRENPCCYSDFLLTWKPLAYELQTESGFDPSWYSFCRLSSEQMKATAPQPQPQKQGMNAPTCSWKVPKFILWNLARILCCKTLQQGPKIFRIVDVLPILCFKNSWVQA